MKKKNWNLIIGLIITGIFLAMAIIGRFWTPCSTTAMSAMEMNQAPSLAHWMGTDNFGRDIFSRVMNGSGSTFIIAVCTVTFGCIVGTIVGALTGYYGGLFDNIIMRLTKLYFTYTGRQVQQAPPGSKRRFRFRTAAFIGLPVLIAAGTVVLGMFFDQIPIFQRDRMPKIVAHRTGGIMASENSLEGVDESVKKGIYGVETDIQRTKDGAYIINHDNTFRRLTGVNKTPGALTLAEVKELRIRDTTGSGALLEVPTMEELLDRCKGRITPFVELKGASADRRMADDAVAAIRERNMTDETVLISLNYKVLDYIKKTYPEFETGVLIFAGLGDVSKLNCDMIIMEEEMSTYAQIQTIHAAGKKAGVWTVNKEEELRRFLDSEADCIITDEIPMAVRIQEELQSRSDVQLMHDRLTLMP